MLFFPIVLGMLLKPVLTPLLLVFHTVMQIAAEDFHGIPVSWRTHVENRHLKDYFRW